MAAQGINIHQGEASPSSSPRGDSFVRSIDRKARSYLKTLERSLSFSTTGSKGEDSSTMTIEFLRARLQAQRAEYKAEKKRSQLLAKKVLELEQRLNFEVEQRRKAVSGNMQLISLNCRTVPPSRSKETHSYSERGLALINSKRKDNSSGEGDSNDWCSDIYESEGHPDGDGVFLICPSCSHQRWESLRGERQQWANQHVISGVNENINAASVLDKESFTSHQEELRDLPREATRCAEHALSMEWPKVMADQASTKFHAITIDCKQESSSEAWNRSDRAYPQSSRVSSNTFAIPTYGNEKTSESGHNVLHDNPRRHATSFYDDTKAATYYRYNYLARSINSCQNYQLEFCQDPVNPVDIMVRPKLSPRREVYMKDFRTSLDVNAKGPEFGSSERTNVPQLSKSMSAGCDRMREHVKEILSPIHASYHHEIRSQRQSPQTLCVQNPKATFNSCRSFSAIEMRYGRKLRGHRMSLDGGLDRLQKVGTEIWRGLEDGESAKFQSNVINNYYSIA